MSFIKGRWYKFNILGKYKDEVAAKFTELSECCTFFRFSEYIRISDGHQIYEGSWYTPEEVIELSEYDLREWIQQVNTQLEIY